MKTRISACFRHECIHCITKEGKNLLGEYRYSGECELKKVIICRDGQCVDFRPEEDMEDAEAHINKNEERIGSGK